MVTEFEATLCRTVAWILLCLDLFVLSTFDCLALQLWRELASGHEIHLQILYYPVEGYHILCVTDARFGGKGNTELRYSEFTP